MRTNLLQLRRTDTDDGSEILNPLEGAVAPAVLDDPPRQHGTNPWQLRQALGLTLIEVQRSGPGDLCLRHGSASLLGFVCQNGLGVESGRLKGEQRDGPQSEKDQGSGLSLGAPFRRSVLLLLCARPSSVLLCAPRPSSVLLCARPSPSRLAKHDAWLIGRARRSVAGRFDLARSNPAGRRGRNRREAYARPCPRAPQKSGSWS